LSPVYKDGVTTSTVTTLRDLLPSLTDELPQVIEEVVGMLREDLPDYADFLAEEPAVVVETAEAALHHLISLAESVPPAGESATRQPPSAMALFEDVGRIEWREGRSLDALLSAYRAGARVAWRHMARTAIRRHVAAEAVAVLAEAVFVFVEELSSASARGYVEEQLATAGERERLRSELAELLVAERAEAATIQAAAARAGWPLPASAALVVVDPAAEAAHQLFARLDARCLPIRRSDLVAAVVPDPEGPGRRARLATALQGLGAVVTSTVPTAQLAAELPTAMVALRLRSERLLVDDPVFVDDHVDAVLVHGDSRVLGALAGQVLAPLDGLPPASRSRLEETLAAWLRAMGDRNAVARTLHVHPQTVRYRLGRLRQLYGAALDDPDTRLRLTLALCWRAPTAVPAQRGVS